MVLYKMGKLFQYIEVCGHNCLNPLNNGGRLNY